MKRQARAAFAELKKAGCPVYDRQDHAGAQFVISGEDNGDICWADYYNEIPEYDFGVNPIVTEILERHGLMCEWENPGMLQVYVD